jgi:hypothetical protein
MLSSVITNSAAVSNVHQLDHTEHRQLLADLLAFFDTDPEAPESRNIKELMSDPTFSGFKRRFLRDLVLSLVDADLIVKLPHTHTRGTRYMTSRAGRQMCEFIEQQAQ